MPESTKPDRLDRTTLFLDSSALFAGVASPSGAARALLLLGEAAALALVVSPQVAAETQRALAGKAPAAVPAFLAVLRAAAIRVVSDPTPEVVAAYRTIIADPTDVPIVVAAMQAGVDFLVTLDRRDFLDDPGVAARSGLRLGTPGDALQ